MVMIERGSLRAEIMIKKFIAYFGLLFCAILFVSEAEAKKPRVPAAVNVVINVSSQSMSVRVRGWSYGYWKVSTARDGYWTPRGSFRVQRTARTYYSKKYDNAPMPYSVFFHGGYAIHGSNHVRALGRPASHGCVRLHPSNAATLYSLVQQYGPSAVRITIVN
jgi:lipoprotein-anchoring transpeptidase ErfK/SrfK